MQLSFDITSPEILYKYRSFKDEYHKRSLCNQEIYIPSANEFNDPWDSKIPFRYNDEDLTNDNIFKKCLQIAKTNFPNKTEEEYHQIAYDNHEKRLLFDEQHLESFDKAQYERICLDFGIYCLTPEKDNFLMWSYYANSHMGEN